MAMITYQKKPAPKRPFGKPFKKKPFTRPQSGKTASVEGEEGGEDGEFFRVKLPRGIETLGVLEQRMGGNRVKVRCLDGKTRICRIPGRLKRKLWVREGDIVLIEPWELSGDEKGDVIFKYRPNQIDFLRKKGLLKALDEFEDF